MKTRAPRAYAHDVRPKDDTDGTHAALRTAAAFALALACVVAAAALDLGSFALLVALASPVAVVAMVVLSRRRRRARRTPAELASRIRARVAERREEAADGAAQGPPPEHASGAIGLTRATRRWRASVRGWTGRWN